MSSPEGQEPDKYERRRAQHLDASIKNYGEELGSTFAAYTNFSVFHIGGSEQERTRDKFAEAIVDALEGSREDKIKAISALLKSVEKVGWDVRDLANPPY